MISNTLKVYDGFKSEQMIKIDNTKLKEIGFNVGSYFSIDYELGKIILTLKGGLMENDRLRTRNKRT